MSAAREATRDGTHLQVGSLCWPKGGTVTIHPALTAAGAAARVLYRYPFVSVACSGTSPVSR